MRWLRSRLRDHGARARTVVSNTGPQPPARHLPASSLIIPAPSAVPHPPMKPTILVQLDTDPQPSVFDAVVAVDAGVDHLFRHGGVMPGNVRDLVYGALFTRGPDDLKRTALFIGG